MLFTSKKPTLAAKWNQLAQDAIRCTNAGPPHAGRAFGLTHTAMFDAWSNYRKRERSTTTDVLLRRPEKEHTEANRCKAFSYAAYRVLTDLFWLRLPPEQKNLFRDEMLRQNFDPEDTSMDISTPQGIGNLSAQLVIDQGYGDGANSYATLELPGYADFSGYAPVNTAHEVKDLKRWQPLEITRKDNTKFIQSYLAPHWGLVRPFALKNGAQFRPVPLAAHPSEKFYVQLQEVLGYSAGLSDEQKSICEFWMGGAGGLTPPEIWCEIGQFMSDQRKHSNDDDICLFFALGNALRDAGIAAWDCKRAYDSIRPVSAIRTLMKGTQIRAWGGPGRGTVPMDGGNWLPYQALDFVTPPFPDYVSGHSAFSAASAEVLKAFFKSDEFKGKYTVAKGSSFVEPKVTPAQDLVLKWDTFTEAANQAGISRLYGGIHFMDANTAGLQLGDQVGCQVWERVSYYFNP